MSEELIKLNNDIDIALFMGYQICTKEYQMKWIGVPTIERLEKTKPCYIPLVYKKESEPLFSDSFEYDKSWSWIMPVVKKINDFVYAKAISKTKLYDGLISVNINMVYESIIFLIKDKNNFLIR
jgi:hypothetical protein